MIGKLGRWLAREGPAAPRKKPELRLVVDPVPEQPPDPAAETWEVVQGAWTTGKNAENPEPETCRARLINRLVDERDQATTAPDRMFFGALLQAVESETLGLPHFPDTAIELDRLLSRSEPDYKAVMRVIESDPQLVGQIWSLARSARFPAPPTSLAVAVSRVGMVEVWRLSVQMAVNSIGVESGSYSRRADSARVHGVLVGDVTAALSKERRGPQFIAGLLHDVGELVVLGVASRTEPQPDLVDRIISEHHAAVGVLVSHAWHMDMAVARTIAAHHDPDAIEAGKTDLSRLVRIADIAVCGAIDHRCKRQSHPELAIKQAACGPMDPSRPLVLAGQSIDRLERDGIQVVPDEV